MATVLLFLIRLCIIILIDVFHLLYNAEFLNAILQEPLTFEVVFGVSVFLAIVSSTQRMKVTMLSDHPYVIWALDIATWSSYSLVVLRVFVNHHGDFVFNYTLLAWLKLLATILVLFYCVLASEVLTAKIHISKLPVKMNKLQKGGSKFPALNPQKTVAKTVIGKANDEKPLIDNPK